MSKAKLRSELIRMEKKQIVDVVLDLYSTSKEAKGYLDFYLNPNEKEKVKEYKDIIEREFYPGGRKEPQVRFSVCRKAVSDFRKLKPSPEIMADLMLFYMENACRFASEYGDMWEQYYISVEGNFAKTVEFIVSQDLLEQFHPRIKQCLSWAEDCGWGFPDSLWNVYAEIVGGKA